MSDITVIEIDPSKKYLFAVSGQLSAEAMDRMVRSVEQWKKSDQKFLVIEGFAGFIGDDDAVVKLEERAG